MLALMKYVLAVLLLICAQTLRAERPNIILIMTDDVGYSDISCMGGEAKTPRLDTLAKGGLIFTQFYNTARCCPTRASLLTGLHPHQAGVGYMMVDSGTEGYTGDLSKNSVTIAEALVKSGYETYAVGKWHVTKDFENKHNWPQQRGFMHYYGTIDGAANYYNPNALVRGNEFISLANDPKYKPEQYYYTNAIGDNAVMFLKEKDAEGNKKPFFMYVAFTAAHWPIQAPEEEIKPYEGMFDKGWDMLRKEKFEKMRAMGLLDKKWKLSFDKSVTPWDDVENKRYETRAMETYAGMITCMDRNVGKIVDYLERTGQLENTVIMYLQDNGACAEIHGRKHKEPTPIPVPEGRTLQPFRKDEINMDRYTATGNYRTRDGRPIYTGLGVMAGPEDTDVGYGRGWAYYSDTPYREYKHFIHEGGISTPLIVHWPDGIKAKGERRAQPGQLMDIMATILDVAKTEYPKEYGGNKIIPAPGRSLAPVFERDMLFYERPLYWEHEGNRGIRVGKWKLVFKSEKRAWFDIPSSTWELYDMENDRTETENLAKEHPELVEKLAAQWQHFADTCMVKPWPAWPPKKK